MLFFQSDVVQMQNKVFAWRNKVSELIPQVLREPLRCPWDYSEGYPRRHQNRLLSAIQTLPSGYIKCMYRLLSNSANQEVKFLLIIDYSCRFAFKLVACINRFTS